MSFADALLLIMASALALFAARWNATAAALALQYFVLRGTWWVAGVEIPTPGQFLIDLTVIAAIYCKAPAYDCAPYLNWRHQLCSAWFERSLWDRIVLAVFPAMWAAYVLLSGDPRWWTLYWLAMAQFIAAGSEAVTTYLSARSAKAGTTPDLTPPGSKFTPGWREWSYG